MLFWLLFASGFIVGSGEYCPRLVDGGAGDIGSLLSSLASSLAFYSDECRELVVYSASLNFSPRSYSRKILRDALSVETLHEKYGRCFFRFGSSGDDLFARVDFPLRGRRGVKVLKMHGHVLFPWAERLVWIDAKIRIGKEIPDFPHCATFVRLPLHRNTFVGEVSLRGHVRAIELANRSDSVEAMKDQIAYYDLNSTRHMADTALFWRRKCPSANRFFEDWYHQIECFSDRDQLSFPFVVKNYLDVVHLVSDEDHWYSSHRFAVGKCRRCVH